MILMNVAYSEGLEITNVAAAAKGELIANPEGVPASGFVCDAGKETT
jgi:hypothetical protein